MSPDFRFERDTMGEVRVPTDAMYGPQTERASENFTISGIGFPRVFIRALGLIKAAAAEANAQLGLLDKAMAASVKEAALEVAEGRWDRHFPLDVFQTGSGTSTNMNANEVVARRASSIFGLSVHPNDHVNRSQSSNDVIPSAIHVSACLLVSDLLRPSLCALEETLLKRSTELHSVVKPGRTHLMDALPVTLGQELGGWASQATAWRLRIEDCLPSLRCLALGGTAVGTGVNCHPEFGGLTAKLLSGHTGISFKEAENHFAAQASMDAVAGLSGQVAGAASAFLKMANDLRWMSSGPSAGLREIELPALQPGSSIMPGKANPVVPEALMMVCVQVLGNDQVIKTANSLGNFQLNTMLPLLAHNLLQSLTILANGVRLFAEKAVALFSPNSAELRSLAGQSAILATVLVPTLGYEAVARIVDQSRKEARPLLEVAAERTGIRADDLARMLDPLSIAGGDAGVRE